MVDLSISGDNLVLHVRGADKLWALKSSLEIPLARTLRRSGQIRLRDSLPGQANPLSFASTTRLTSPLLCCHSAPGHFLQLFGVTSPLHRDL
jgi:hypothetical protein